MPGGAPGALGKNKMQSGLTSTGLRISTLARAGRAQARTRPAAVQCMTVLRAGDTPAAAMPLATTTEGTLPTTLKQNCSMSK